MKYIYRTLWTHLGVYEHVVELPIAAKTLHGHCRLAWASKDMILFVNPYIHGLQL